MMDKSRKIILATCALSFLLLVFNSCESVKNPNLLVLKRKALNGAQTLRIKRFLHPMPQELRLSDFAYEIPVNDCGLKNISRASSEEAQAIANFKATWLKKRGGDLKKKNTRLTIVAGLLENSPELRKAAENGVFDAKYLSERPNREQAYVIATLADSDKITVYVAANAPTGLNYGLLTLDQLFNSLSKTDKLFLPECNIVDWPDLKDRGFEINSGYLSGSPKVSPFYQENSGLLERFSLMKLNVDYYAIRMKVSPEKKIYFGEGYRKCYLTAKKYFVQAVPVLIHTDYWFNPTRKWMSNFPELASHGKTGKRIYGSESGHTFCYGNPKSQEAMDKVFEALVEAGVGDRLQLWLAETESCCHCNICKGDLRGHFVNELKHVLHSYQKIRQLNPRFKMDLTLSQATYPHHYALLDHIPKDVGIDIYAGCGANNTYKSRFGEYFLTPQAEEIVARGYETGAVPSIGPCILWDYMMFPTYMSQFIKLRMSEIKDRGLQRFCGWMNELFSQKFNLAAVAEFSWNVDGRTSREFVAAWAERKGIRNPDKVADIIKTLEYPIRALAGGMRSNKMTRPVKRMVSHLNEKKPYWSNYFNMLASFEYGKHEELSRVLNDCERAVKLAKEIGDEELIAGSLLLKQWVEIFERYAIFMESKNPEEKKNAKENVKKLAMELPKLRDKWMAFNTISKYRLKKSQNGFEQTMKAFDEIK